MEMAEHWWNDPHHRPIIRESESVERGQHRHCAERQCAQLTFGVSIMDE
jgi:hypothetical protein